MSAPIIWILIPFLFSVLLLFLNAYRLLVVVLGTVFCLVLALLAWLLPIGAIINLGLFTIELSSTLQIFGRQFVIMDGDRFLLVFLYIIGAFWFFGEGILRKNSLFVPVGLAIIPLSVAALTVKPFLYAALIVEIIVLISIPVLVPPGSRFGQGIMRYLIFQTLAMACVLLAGWSAAGVETDPTNQPLLFQALVLLGLGLAFWLAVFPFHTWIPLLVDEVHPYQACFILIFLPLVVLLLALDFINSFSWIRQFAGLGDILRMVGLIMVTTGGIWAAVQDKLTRLMGYFIIAEMGFSLLALSLGTIVGYEIFVSMFFPRILVIAVWALSVSSAGESSFKYKDMVGLLRSKPIESIGILVACFSLSGLPLLANFPLRQVLFENIAQQSSNSIIWLLIGTAGLFIASIRILLVLISSKDSNWTLKEDWRSTILLVIGIGLVFLAGLMPELFLPAIKTLLNAFTNIG